MWIDRAAPKVETSPAMSCLALSLALLAVSGEAALNPSDWHLKPTDWSVVGRGVAGADGGIMSESDSRTENTFFTTRGAVMSSTKGKRTFSTLMLTYEGGLVGVGVSAPAYGSTSWAFLTLNAPQVVVSDNNTIQNGRYSASSSSFSLFAFELTPPHPPPPPPVLRY